MATALVLIALGIAILLRGRKLADAAIDLQEGTSGEGGTGAAAGAGVGSSGRGEVGAGAGAAVGSIGARRPRERRGGR